VGKAPKEMWYLAAKNATMPKNNCFPSNGKPILRNLLIQFFKLTPQVLCPKTDKQSSIRVSEY
jgi:hypothetical protein